MSFDNSKRVNVGVNKSQNGPFSDGYIDNATNINLKETASPYLRNARIDGNATIIRPGHSLFANLTAGSYPKGIASYLKSTGDRLIVRHNQDTDKKLVSITSAGVVTEIDTSTDIASDNRMVFTNIGDILYCTNGSDDYGKLDGTTYTTPNVGIASFAPAFTVSFNGCMWASGWSTNPNVVYKSVADDYDDFNSAGADSFTFNETITGLSANIEALFYFTKNTISVTGLADITDTAGTLSYVTRSLTVKEGAINHGSIVEVGNRTYYITPSNKINMVAKGNSIDGFETLELSERKYNGIDNILNSLDSDQSDCFGYFLPEQNIIKWFFKTNGATFNDICIVYDVSKDCFLVDGQSYYYDGVSFGQNNYTVSMIEPKVYLDEYGQDDEDSIIPFEYWTKEFYISDPTYKKVFWETRVLVDINELAELVQEIWIDGALKDSKTIDKDNIEVSEGGIGVGVIGEIAIGESIEGEDELQEVTILRTKGNLNIRGKKIQVRFFNNTLAGKVRLKSLSIRVEVLNELTNMLTI